MFELEFFLFIFLPFWVLIQSAPHRDNIAEYWTSEVTSWFNPFEKMRGGQNQILKLTELLKSDGVVCKTAQMRKTQFHYN